ncbi:hypothetical protein MRX96_000264 [Rhipicephalus microplus]
MLAVEKRGGSAVANAPAFASEPRCGDATAIEVTVKGTEIIPEEVRTADWITKVGKHVKDLRDSARGQGRQDRDRQGGQDCNARAESGAEPGEDRKKTAAANAIYKKLGHKLISGMVAGSSSDDTEVDPLEFTRASSAPQQPSNIQDCVTGRRNSSSDSGDGARRKWRKYTGAEIKEKMLNEQRLLRELIFFNKK